MTFSSAGRRQKREQHLSFALTPSFRRYILYVDLDLHVPRVDLLGPTTGRCMHDGRSTYIYRYMYSTTMVLDLHVGIPRSRCKQLFLLDLDLNRN